MKSLSARWHRTAFHRYFQDLDPIDRATFWIAVSYAILGGLCFSLPAHGS